jgi:hypothetical protein
MSNEPQKPLEDVLKDMTGDALVSASPARGRSLNNGGTARTLAFVTGNICHIRKMVSSRHTNHLVLGDRVKFVHRVILLKRNAIDGSLHVVFWSKQLTRERRHVCPNHYIG